MPSRSATYERLRDEISTRALLLEVLDFVKKTKVLVGSGKSYLAARRG